MYFMLTFLAYFFVFLLQFFVIFEIEQFFHSNGYASFLYLPHAVRIIAYYIIGPLSLLPIFIAQCITATCFIGGDTTQIINLSFISTASTFLGFFLYKNIKDSNYFQLGTVVDWKKIIIIGFLASLFNSYISNVYLNTFIINQNYKELTFIYLTGDVLGLFLGMILFIIFIKIFVLVRGKNEPS